MPEAEDVLVGAARHATAYAMGLWRRHRGVESRGLVLADVKPRLEMLIHAVVGAQLAVRTSAEPPPLTVLKRLFHRAGEARQRAALPATDGVVVYLPRRYDLDDDAFAMECFRITALQQAIRCVRGTAAHYPHQCSRLVQDWYLLGEAAAADRRLIGLAPGYAGALERVRRHVGERRAAAPGGDPPGAVELAYRALLATPVRETPASVPAFDAPADTLAWALAQAGTSADHRYVPIARDLVLGAVERPEARTPSREGDAQDSAPGGRPRQTRMSRRPRVREAAPDEDDREHGVWMVQTTEPSEHVEDPFGLQRPLDQGDEHDLDGLAESVSDLPEARLVSTAQAPREVLVTEDALDAERQRVQPAAEARGPDVYVYPEWDYRRGAYGAAGATVRVAAAQAGDAAWAEAVLHRHRSTLRSIRRRFEALRARRTLLHAQAEGDEIDIEAYVRALGDARARRPGDERLYVVHRPARLDFALMVLVDVSGSTDAWTCASQRIIDLEKEALAIVAAALDALRIDYAIHAFSGCGRHGVRVAALKAFEEAGGAAVVQRIAALEPEAFTRLGAALRHATATLLRRPASRRLLLLLSDGKPNDCDEYEGRYGVEDLRQALAEAQAQGVHTFCVTVDRRAGSHLSALFGAGRYSIVHEPRRLAAALLDWLRHAAVALR